MKTLLSTLIFFLMGLTSIYPQDYSLVGTWQGTKDGETGKFIFDKKGYAIMDQGGEKIGGKKYIAQGMTLKVIYDVNPTTDPKTIDFIIKKVDDDTEITRMVGIYKFVNEKTLILNLNTTDKIRPRKFDPHGEDQIVLSKIR
ncbi:MAG: hypothetical protein WBB31_19625 [Saprospiraceae bacterium]